MKDTEENGEGNGLRTRSFRYEDYNNRRVFLRSYPLQWGGEEEEDNNNEENEEERKGVTNEESNYNRKKKPIKKMIMPIIHWGGGKVLILRRFKHKFTIHFIACISLGFKPPTSLISVK
ncbi:hypothetical protein FNV43_RR25797 [Rhamnella rubrinervis]|uniref:Uncharacterized protein n=1 Tax=Rhamnella rubrinervis TaxID=2594499 RepID=A0A8K0GJ15_9ROSA|nr:hypothetical protein FNV43_RR25797 [Rhamnella rubrinervis]